MKIATLELYRGIVVKPRSIVWAVVAALFSCVPSAAQDSSVTARVLDYRTWTIEQTADRLGAVEELTDAERLNAVIYAHAIGLEAGRRTGKDFYFVIETARRAHAAGVRPEEITAWIESTAAEWRAGRGPTRAAAFGEGIVAPDELLAVAQALSGGGRYGAIARIFVDVMNESAAGGLMQDSLVDYGARHRFRLGTDPFTLGALSADALDLEQSRWSTAHLLRAVTVAATDPEFAVLMDAGARAFDVARASIADGPEAILDDASALRAELERRQTYGAVLALAQAIEQGAERDRVSAIAEDLGAAMTADIRRAGDAVRDTIRPVLERGTDGNAYQAALEDHGRMFAGAGVAVGVLTLISDDPAIPKIAKAMSTFEKLHKAGIEQAFGKISVLEMTNVYLAGANVLIGLMSSSGQSFEGAVMEALKEMNQRLVDLQNELLDFRLENREAHRVTHALLSRLTETFEDYLVEWRADGARTRERINDVIDQIELVNRRLDDIEGTVAAGFRQIVRAEDWMVLDTCLSKRAGVPIGRSIEAEEFRRCREAITGMVNASAAFVEIDGALALGSDLREPVILLRTLIEAGLIAPDQAVRLPRVRRDTWLAGVNALDVFLRSWPEHHARGRQDVGSAAFVAEPFIDALLRQGAELQTFRAALGGLRSGADGVARFEPRDFAQAVAVVETAASQALEEVFARAPMAREQTGFGLDPFAVDAETNAYLHDFSAAISTPLLRQRARASQPARLPLRNCVPIDPDKHVFVVDNPILERISGRASASLAAALAYGMVEATACLDFADYTSRGSVRISCPPPPPPSGQLPFRSEPFPLHPIGYYTLDRSNPAYPDGYGIYRRGDLPAFLGCSSSGGRVDSGYHLPYLGSADGSDENRLHSSNGFFVTRQLGGIIRIDFTISTPPSEPGGERGTIARFGLEGRVAHEDVLFRTSACLGPGAWGSDACRAAGQRQLADLIARAQGDVERVARDGVVVNLMEAAVPELSCAVRARLQAETLAEVSGFLDETATAVGRSAADLRDKQAGLMSLLLASGIDNLPPRPGMEDDPIVDQLRAIAALPLIDETALNALAHTDCAGARQYGDPAAGEINDQFAGVYTDRLNAALESIEDSVAAREVQMQDMVRDLEVDRAMTRLRELRAWIALSTLVHLGD